MNALQKIEIACRLFRDHYDRLAAELQALEDERQALVRRRIHPLRQQVQNLAEMESRLAAEIDAAADQFERPRTRVFHGITVGLQKGMTSFEWDSDEAVISLIRELVPNKAPTLIVRPPSKLSKAALKNLPEEQLERIGVRATAGKDRRVIKPVDKEVDRMVGALLKSLQKELETPEIESEAA